MAGGATIDAAGAGRNCVVAGEPMARPYSFRGIRCWVWVGGTLIGALADQPLPTHFPTQEQTVASN